MTRASATSRAQPRSLCPRVLLKFRSTFGPPVVLTIPLGIGYNRLSVHYMGGVCRVPFARLPRLTLDMDHVGCREGVDTCRRFLCSGSQLSREIWGKSGCLTCGHRPCSATVVGAPNTKARVTRCGGHFYWDRDRRSIKLKDLALKGTPSYETTLDTIDS